MGIVTVLPRGRPLTRTDLERVPDDGHRYELVDGTLVVTPAPSPRHQIVLARLYRLLADACPADLIVLFAPLDVALDDDTVLQPDLLVASRTDFTDRDLPVAPVLALEVLSPSTRQVDLTLKKARYEAAGCPSYWVFDPDEPSVVVWELVEGTYAEGGRAVAEEILTVSAPYAVSLTPAALTDDAR